MPQAETIRDAILDAAERRARTSGYNGFSFRDLAADVGIKSASVHYHFPTKGDLARELMERYRMTALRTLDRPDDAMTALARLVGLFRVAATQREMCLCGALGASVAALPPEVQTSAARFTEALVNWLEQARDSDKDLPLPSPTIVALLEGALLMSVTASDPEKFEKAIVPLLPPRAPGQVN